MKVGDKVVIKHQPELGVRVVEGFKFLDDPITLWDGKVIMSYIMVSGLGGYHRDSLEVICEYL